MEDYTKEDVIKALLSIESKTRKRPLVDQRSYLIGILAYRFMMTEHGIAKECGLKRDTINYNKKLPLQFYNDKLYMRNVYVYSTMFPFDFSVIEASKISLRQKRIELDVDMKFYNKLSAISSILGHNDVRLTIKFFLQKSLKLWEE